MRLPEGPADGHVWPTLAQRHLLDAALQDGERAIAAFDAWQSAINVEEPFDWQMQRLLPLVFGTQSRLNSADPLMPRLKGVYRRAWVETHTLTERMRGPIGALVDAGIPVMLLKGAALAHRYYAHPAQRAMSDYDIAVKPTQVRQAIALLRTLGWETTAPFEEVRQRWAHALQLVHRDGGELDLHWRIMIEANDAVTASMWARAEPMRWCETSVFTLDPTDLLLHTMVHAVRWNSAAPLRWVADVHQIMRVRGSDIDWSRLKQLAITMQVGYRTALALEYLAQHEDLRTPPSLSNDLRASTKTWRERLEAKIILADQARWPSRFQYFYWSLLGDFARVAEPERGVASFLWAFPRYLCFRFSLNGRRELLPIVWRGVRHRISFGALRESGQGEPA